MDKITLPKGWTADSKQLNYDFYWRDDDSDGKVMAKEHGLKSPQPIMCSTSESGDCLYMFQSGSKYYLWNQIEGNVWEIVAPADLEDIVREIAKLGVGSLTIARVPQVAPASPA